MTSYVWSEDDFRKKVEARAAAKGVTVREILRLAGVAGDTFNKAPAQGRRIDTVLKIAKAADMSIEEALDLPTAPTDPELQRQLARLALVADVAAHLYVALSGRLQPKSDTTADEKGGTELVAAIMELIGRSAG